MIFSWLAVHDAEARHVDGRFEQGPGQPASLRLLLQHRSTKVFQSNELALVREFRDGGMVAVSFGRHDRVLTKAEWRDLPMSEGQVELRRPKYSMLVPSQTVPLLGQFGDCFKRSVDS